MHSKAVDYAKTGVTPTVPPDLRVSKYPDFMEKDDKPEYESTSILGIFTKKINDLLRYFERDQDNRFWFILNNLEITEENIFNFVELL